MKEIKIGQVVYYELDKDIYQDQVIRIEERTINIKKKHILRTFYQMKKGLALEREAFYTIEELFESKDKLEYILNNKVKNLLGDKDE